MVQVPTFEEFVALRDELDEAQLEIIELDKRVKTLETPPAPPATALKVGIYYPLKEKPGTTTVEAWIQKFKDAGITRLHDWALPNKANLPLLDAAGKLGMEVWLELAWVFDGGYFPGRLPTIMLPEYLAHPALTGWFACDEADLRGVTPTTTFDAYNKINTIDANRPVGMVLTFPEKSTAGLYNTSADLFLADEYPIPYAPPQRVGQEVTTMKTNVAKGKEVSAVIQAYNWKTELSTTNPGRWPTIQEFRDMGKSALQAGAKDLWLYTFTTEMWGIYGATMAETINQWRQTPSV